MTNSVKKPVIAIDGPAASGKGTIAKALAEKMGFAFLDTGMLYRAVGWAALREGVEATNEAAVVEIAYKMGENFDLMRFDEESLRSPNIAQMASMVAVIPDVRVALFNLQRQFALSPPAKMRGAVLDGRDIGSHICPDAEVKIFVTAAVEIRAQRRMLELQKRGMQATYEAVLCDLQERDARDSQRGVAPLQRGSDAFLLDTTDMDARTALALAETFVNNRLDIATQNHAALAAG
ncbi:MAG: (d)CMP kinase [Alphaproteobacteria bacterium]